MLLAAIALALSLTFAGSTPAAPPATSAPQPSFSHLPSTQPGLSHFEGVFLVTTADDESRAVYFIASNSRHSISWTDMQIELQLNPLWPVFSATPDQVLDYPEGAPVGAAPTGLLGGSPEAEPVVAEQAQAEAPVVSDAPVPANGADAPVNIDDASNLDDANHIDDVDPASADASTYTVQRGDSAFKIARRFGIDEGALLDANAITNPNRVYVGQLLTIPDSSS